MRLLFSATLTLDPGNYFLVAVGVSGDADGGYIIFEVYVNE